MKLNTLPVLFLLLGLTPLLAAEPPPTSQQDSEFITALKNGKFSSDLRYRYETVEQTGFPRDAKASTLRIRAGYRSGEFKGWQMFLEFEDLRPIGDDAYNSTDNGKTQFPVVADPKDTELNQFYLDSRFREKDLFRLGRQRININNQRFFGAVGFRQNEQTFDGVRYDFLAGTSISGTVAYLTRANRIFGAHHSNPALANTDLSAPFAEVSFKFESITLTGFTHFLDFDDAPLTSHKNLGLRANGKAGGENVKFTYYLEYADQSDYKDGASTVDADYWHAKFDVGLGSSSFGAGYELLGGDGIYAFQTPLATLHAFNGFADKFLTTPATGLEDIYLSYRYQRDKFSAGVIFHDYAADTGGASYGDELDLYFGYQVNKQLGVKFEYADYNADAFSTDTQKLWLSATHKFN